MAGSAWDFFGDMMQRIYSDGKEQLALKAIPGRWAMPRKRMNHRCPSRVIEVINNIRRDVDGEEQVPRSDAEKGVVRVFIAPQAGVDPFACSDLKGYVSNPGLF